MSISERFVAMISETYHVAAENISPENSFEELGIDSLGAMGMICDIEDEFNISVPNEEVLSMRTVGEALNSLRKLVSEQAAETGSGIAA